MKRLSTIIQKFKRGSTAEGSKEDTLNNVSTTASLATTVMTNKDSITAVHKSDMIRVRVYTIRGKLTDLEVSRNLTGSELKKLAMIKLLYSDIPNPIISNSTIDLSYLIYSKTQDKLNENSTLQDMDINDSDEFVLVQKILKIDKQENLQGPTLNEIAEATKTLPSTNNTAPVVNIESLVPQNDVQFDIRRILISLAQSSAYVIGAGPYAERLISTLKLRLINRRKHESDTIQCLVDMGFSRESVIYALRVKKNVYLAALEWLIENQSTVSLDVTATPESSISNKVILKNVSMNKSNTPSENIESLLEIIRINSHHFEPPPKSTIKSLVDMGFVEENVVEALKVTRNNQAAACEWLIGNWTRSLTDLREGLPSDSPVLKVILSSPQVQLSLGNPKMFLAYISMLENYSSLNMWLSDSDTSGVLGYVLRTYHEEKHVTAKNQFSNMI